MYATGKWNTRIGRTIELKNCSKMEKQSKFRIQILKFLSQAAAPAVTYKSPPASPCRNPIASIIPKEARRKQRNGSSRFASREPTSPTVSCMGQVKGKNKHKKKKSKPKAKQVCPPPPPPPQESTSLALCAPKKKVFKLSNVVSKVLIHQRKTKDDASVPTSSLSRPSCGLERVPSLGQMKRFESRRGVLSDFDILEVDDRLYNLKTGVGGEEDDDGDDEKNKKDGIMLWKRRNISPPTPIQL